MFAGEPNAKSPCANALEDSGCTPSGDGGGDSANLEAGAVLVRVSVAMAVAARGGAGASFFSTTIVSVD